MSKTMYLHLPEETEIKFGWEGEGEFSFDFGNRLRLTLGEDTLKKMMNAVLADYDWDSLEDDVKSVRRHRWRCIMTGYASLQEARESPDWDETRYREMVDELVAEMNISLDERDSDSSVTIH